MSDAWYKLSDLHGKLDTIEKASSKRQQLSPLLALFLISSCKMNINTFNIPRAKKNKEFEGVSKLLRCQTQSKKCLLKVDL